MNRYSSFQPDWASCPGDTISDILFEREMSLEDFSLKMQFSSKASRDLISGKVTINEKIAHSLSRALGASQYFWLNRQTDYLEQKKELENIESENRQWIKTLPYNDMAKYGWVSKTRKINERLSECLAFFDVSSVRDWAAVYESKLVAAAYRTSSSFDSTPEAIIAWLRYGEIKAMNSPYPDWSPDRFRSTLLDIRYLTKNTDPVDFVPQIQSAFSLCGVALVIAPAPSGCRASGAAHFIDPARAVIQLSLRHLSDDHFWFTLFHEAGHLLLHNNQGLFLEGTGCDSEQEDEANKFAQNILIPDEYKDEFKSLSYRNWKKIPRFAKKVGVSNGVVVGQLQHHKIIGHHQLNKLKTRYKWADESKASLT